MFTARCLQHRLVTEPLTNSSQLLERASMSQSDVFVSGRAPLCLKMSSPESSPGRSSSAGKSANSGLPNTQSTSGPTHGETSHEWGEFLHLGRPSMYRKSSYTWGVFPYMGRLHTCGKTSDVRGRLSHVWEDFRLPMYGM